LNDAAGNGLLQVTQVERAGTSAADMWTSAGGDIPAGTDSDHTVDLQLGGSNELGNLNPLDYSVNRSLGT
jgi:filamentous hemagglutinin